MKHVSWAYILVFLSGFFGCASAQFTKTGDVQLPPRPAGCDFSIYTATPSSPFKEIGLVNFSVSGPDMAKRFAQELVCNAGGNGLILSGFTSDFGYTKGTVISIKSP